MRKFIAVIIFCLSCSAVQAAGFSDQALKLQGRSLAQYEYCSYLAAELSDKVMFSYYSEMYNDNLLKVQAYAKAQSKVVFNEQQSSLKKFKQFDRQRLGLFCTKRFDPLARKIQENKLAKKS